MSVLPTNTAVASANRPVALKHPKKKRRPSIAHVATKLKIIKAKLEKAKTAEQKQSYQLTLNVLEKFNTLLQRVTLGNMARNQLYSPNQRRADFDRQEWQRDISGADASQPKWKKVSVEVRKNVETGLLTEVALETFKPDPENDKGVVYTGANYVIKFDETGLAEKLTVDIPTKKGHVRHEIDNLPKHLELLKQPVFQRIVTGFGDNLLGALNKIVDAMPNPVLEVVDGPKRKRKKAGAPSVKKSASFRTTG